MAENIRSFGNPFEIVDHTESILVIPNQWQLISSMGLFRSEGVSQNTITLEKITKSQATIIDRFRGERNTQNKMDGREIRSFPIPHFPFDDYITPEDVQGKRAYGAQTVDTIDLVRARKLERMRNSFAQTMEIARAKLITTGEAYAPSGTIGTINYYNEFGVTRKEVDFVFGTSTTDIRGKIEEAIADIQDRALTGEIAGGFVILCSPVFFQKLINHATIVSAYQYYSSTQEPLRQRLDAQGLDYRFRDFVHMGVRFIEYRGSYDGTSLIPSGDAYMLPTNMGELFETYYGPANKLHLVNTIGEEMYAWESVDPDDQFIKIQTESNFLNVLRRPQCIARLYSST